MKTFLKCIFIFILNIFVVYSTLSLNNNLIFKNELKNELKLELKQLNSDLIINNLKIESIYIDKCIGSLNSILSKVDKSQLKSITIANSSLNDKIIDFSDYQESQLSLTIQNTVTSSKIKNLKAFNSFDIRNSYIGNIDFNDFSDQIEFLILNDYNELFLDNISALDKLTNLKTLELRAVNLLNNEILINNLSDLKILVLDNLSELPKINKNCRLVQLSINSVYNNKDISDLLFNVDSLEFLSFVRMNLKEIPKEIFKAHKLKYLLLNNNKIKYVPDNIVNLKNLKYLYLDDNIISDFNYNIFEIEGLNQVDIEFNDLNARVAPPIQLDIIINQEGNPFVD
ncbi:MAG: leucine-rich repeat domain-containing protein [Candidatus Kapaibacterium sp.]